MTQLNESQLFRKWTDILEEQEKKDQEEGGTPGTEGGPDKDPSPDEDKDDEKAD
jgi:hypothetical protein